MENKPRTRPRLLQLKSMNNIDHYFFRSFPSFKNKVNEIYDEEKMNRIKTAQIFYEYTKHLLLATLMCVFTLFLAIFAASILAKSNSRYDRSKYRKVIKEGVFFDTVEYHER